MKTCAANGTLCISLIYKLDFVIGLNCTRRTSREGKKSLLVNHGCVVHYSVGFPILHWEAEAVAGRLAATRRHPPYQSRTGPFLGPPGMPHASLQLSCHHALLIVSHSLCLPDMSGSL